MLTFIFYSIFWILAIYGLIEVLKNIFYIFSTTHLRADGIYVIVAVKNEENKIEGFLRTILFRMIYGKEDMVKKVVITDLGSKDDTPKIIEKLQRDYSSTVKAVNWKECKEIIDNINEA